MNTKATSDISICEREDCHASIATIETNEIADGSNPFEVLSTDEEDKKQDVLESKSLSKSGK